MVIALSLSHGLLQAYITQIFHVSNLFMVCICILSPNKLKYICYYIFGIIFSIFSFQIKQISLIFAHLKLWVTVARHNPGMSLTGMSLYECRYQP